jgi:hypothetical protein
VTKWKTQPFVQTDIGDANQESIDEYNESAEIIIDAKNTSVDTSLKYDVKCLCESVHSQMAIKDTHEYTQW